MEKFAAAIRELNVGNGLEEGVSQGLLINAAAIDKVKAHVADAVPEAVASYSAANPMRWRHLFEPTLIADVTTDAQRAAKRPLTRRRRDALYQRS